MLLKLFRSHSPEAEFTPEEIADILEGSARMDAGLYYYEVPSHDDTWRVACNWCKQAADIMADPFPHLPGCPLEKNKNPIPIFKKV
jgi:hypothetical protein